MLMAISDVSSAIYFNVSTNDCANLSASSLPTCPMCPSMYLKLTTTPFSLINCKVSKIATCKEAQGVPFIISMCAHEVPIRLSSLTVSGLKDLPLAHRLCSCTPLRRSNEYAPLFRPQSCCQKGPNICESCLQSQVLIFSKCT